MLSQHKITDRTTGNTILAIGNEGRDTAHHYTTAMSWLTDSRHLIVLTDLDRETKAGKIVRHDTLTGQSQILMDNGVWPRGVVGGDDQLYLFEGQELYSLHAWSGERRTICRLDDNCILHGPLSITNDSQTLGVYWLEGDQEWVIATVDARSGQVAEAARPGFVEPFPVANHAMINPVDSSCIFYSHEGATEHIADRLWVASTATGSKYNVFAQKRDENGKHVEYVGHEMWASDGSGLYFVKYAHSPHKPAGVYYADRNGKSQTFINGDYLYWHVSVSPDGRYAAADTQEAGKSKIVLIDLATRQSKLLCELPCRGIHPGHPHPSFSPDSQKLVFTYADEQDTLWVGVTDIGEGGYTV
ncbi:TolB family protein [Paenibacillus sp. GCM10027626]|uniref:TolB family protein n=1 Tax=Paenibacillus sp. GCM10027626 TaxID=3273411 RepID=UPI0036430B69